MWSERVAWMAVALSAALGLGLAGCGGDSSLTYDLEIKVLRASTAITVDDAQVDGGGDVPRTINARYAFPDWPDATHMTFTIQARDGVQVLGQATATPGVCEHVAATTTETIRIVVDATGAVKPGCSSCAGASGEIIGGTCP